MGFLVAEVRNSQALKIGYSSELKSLNYTINKLEPETQMFSKQFIDNARAVGENIKKNISVLQTDKERIDFYTDNLAATAKIYPEKLKDPEFIKRCQENEKVRQELYAKINNEYTALDTTLKPVKEVDALNHAKEEKDVITQKLNKLASVPVDDSGEFKSLCDYVDRLEAEANEHPEKLDNPSFKKDLDDAKSQRDYYLSKFEQDSNEQQNSSKTGDKLKLYI